jgi:F-box domain
MDKALPLELLYNISKYLPAEDYFRFRRCSTSTLGLKSLIAVTFEEYQMLAIKFDDVFQSRLVVNLKDDHIHSDSIKFLVRNLHQLESWKANMRGK